MPDPASAGPDLAELYRDTRLTVTELVVSLRPDELTTPVPTCPGWSVSDVVSHLAGVVEDVLAGRLTGPPTDEQTATQVARHRGEPISDVVSQWSEMAGGFETMIGAVRVWPAVLDVVSHEHDIRGAIDRPGNRNSPSIYHGAEALCTRAVGLPRTIRVVWEDGERCMGPDAGDELVLRTTRFDTVRWRLGRRSKLQMAHLDWSADPQPVLDHLVVFGPSGYDIIE